MLKQEYIQKVKVFLLEDLNTNEDISPNGMFAIGMLSKQYQGKVPDYTIDCVMESSRWIQTYLTHCRHLSRPIDTVLVTNLINSFDFS